MLQLNISLGRIFCLSCHGTGLLLLCQGLVTKNTWLGLGKHHDLD